MRELQLPHAGSPAQHAFDRPAQQASTHVSKSLFKKFTTAQHTSGQRLPPRALPSSSEPPSLSEAALPSSSSNSLALALPGCASCRRWRRRSGVFAPPASSSPSPSVVSPPPVALARFLHQQACFT
jgi:hypothetical protein